MYDLIIRDGTIVRSSGRLVADIAIEDGKIAYVGGNPAGKAREEISAIGRFVMPGVIDTHVHVCNADRAEADAWSRASREAVRGGVTTILDGPTPLSPTLDGKAVDEKCSVAARHSVANFGVLMGASASNLSLLAELWDAGKICGTKVYMYDRAGDGEASTHLLEDVFVSTKGLIAVHAEDQAILEVAHEKWKDNPSPDHNEVRPPEASVRAVETLIELVQRTGRSVHICHLSTAAELAVLDPYRGDLPITCEVSPQHLFLSVENAGDQGNFTKMNPPVRSELDRRALMAALKRGRMDTFGSSHFAFTKAQKEQDYWSAPAGLPGVGTMFPLILGALKNGRLGLEMMVSMLAETPARLFGLDGKGVIRQGADADIVLFREGVTTKLTQPMVGGHCDWSPFVGREVGVLPDLVVVGGRVASRDGALMEDLQPGSLVNLLPR